MAKKIYTDLVKIFIKAGDGGSGHIGFRRERFIPKGGPSGGDGGKGGDIWMIASKHISSLSDFRKKRHHKAKNGAKGGTRQKTGANGADVYIAVPPGTIAKDAETGEILGEVFLHDEKYLLQKGGKGGLGNIHFKSSVTQAPQKATPGKVIEPRWLSLELKTLADVGLVGLPNAGKSTLISQITKANSKVGAYPFTTIHPLLGVLTFGEYTDKTLTIADIPGLIEGASDGVGLGFDFLRHIERASSLMYVIDASSANHEKIYQDYQTLFNELKNYDETLLEKKNFIVLNKIDLIEAKELKKLQKEMSHYKLDLCYISAKEGDGCMELRDKIEENFLELSEEEENIKKLFTA